VEYVAPRVKKRVVRLVMGFAFDHTLPVDGVCQTRNLYSSITNYSLDYLASLYCVLLVASSV
jgi:hypothetical protein